MSVKIPKKIHLCWFSGDDYPVETKICLESWAKILPDFEIRLWTARDAKSIGCQWIDEALAAGQWAFASDAVRFYALWREGGVYMDSDIRLFRRFDDYIPDRGCALFSEITRNGVGLQPAFVIGEKGDGFCQSMYAYYDGRQFVRRDGSFDKTPASAVMTSMAEKLGYVPEDSRQTLADGAVNVWPSSAVASGAAKIMRTPETFAAHMVLGSWIDRGLYGRLAQAVRHAGAVVKYAVTRIGASSQLPPAR